MRDIITTIIFISLICVIYFTNQNIGKLETAEERRILQNNEIKRLQNDVLSLDIRLTKAEIEKTIIKKFVKDMKDHKYIIEMEME